jgi:outer membrane immunogenic protein
MPKHSAKAVSILMSRIVASDSGFARTCTDQGLYQMMKYLRAFLAYPPAAGANAADLGGDCCADLEERGPKLGARPARQGNGRISLTFAEQVCRSASRWTGPEPAVRSSRALTTRSARAHRRLIAMLRGRCHMRKSLRALCVGGSLVVAPTVASAHAPGTVVDWSGLYVGLHAGYGWSDVSTDLREPASLVQELEFLKSPTGASHEDDGFLGGGHVGLQHQWGRWVLGVEASLTLGGLRGQSREDFVGSFFLINWAGESTFKTETENFMSIAGRLGYAHDRWLGYVKGGFATAAIRTRGNVDGESCTSVGVCSDFGGPFSSRERHYGWLAGGGLEYMVTPNLIVGLEYNYTDLGARTHTGSVTFGNFSGETRARVDPDGIHAVTARVSIKFGRDEPELSPTK